jgi:hypothetical protein
MKRKIVLVSAIMILLASPCAFAQQSQEKDDLSLFEIDRLIRRTEYDEALKQLNIYIEKNPEKFDSAQSRIKRIMHARNQYSILAEKLIKLIQTDPGNNKEIYEITAQLEKFEKHPSDQNLQFIADLKKSAEFNYFRALFLEIQNTTAALSHKGDYIAAVEKAKEGFWLYRDDFYETQEENEAIISAVDKTLAELDQRIAEFEEKNYLPRFNAAVNEFIKAVKAEQYDQAVSRLAEVEGYFRNYNTLRNGIVKVGNDLQAEFAEVQKLNSDLTDASFLPFMFRFVFGVDSVPDSGILGAVNTQWNDAAGRMNDAVYSVLLKKYGTYETAINTSLVNEVSRYSGLEKRVLDIYKIAEANPPANHILQNPYEPYYALGEYAQNLCSNALRLSGVYAQVQNTGAEQEKTLTKITNGSAEASEIRALFDSSSQLSKVIGDKESQKLEGFAWTLAYNTAAEKAGRRDFDGLSNKYSQMLDSVFTDTAAIFNRSWTEITNYYKTSSDSVYQNALAYYNSSEKYRAGFFTKIPQNVLAELRTDISKSVVYENTFNEDPELDFGIYYSYPDLAIQISNYTQTSAQNGIKTIDGYEAIIVENYGAQSQTVEGALEVDGLISDTRAYLEEDRQKLRSLITNAQEQVAVARRQMNAAQLARNEADIRFNEAQNALRNNDFDTARKKLQDALTKYDESLTNQNDEVLRSETDRKLQSLGENIAKAENEVVVREVRDLKTRAKDAYFNGRFDDAEKYLNQAKIRWAVTNVDEDEEISNLLNFVNTAISMKTGREILPSAPQYPEMSQLLNISYQYFDEGSRKIGEGNRAAGEADLALALESIQKLQYVYPLNQEASILTLRINRLLDPKKFSEEFAQKIDMAKMMCKSKDTQQEGYANLLDYYQLDPNYKGLKDLIYQVEIDIGIRQKPVSNTGANRAKKLVADAQKIYNSAGNDTAKLQNALSKIDEALALVSDNKEAMALKDKITTKIGGNTATVLSTEDERLYQLAIQRLQNNNVVGANAIVEQLLKKPQNSNSQKIKDLKNKIEARS